jgi:hypothetical protein
VLLSMAAKMGFELLSLPAGNRACLGVDWRGEEISSYSKRAWVIEREAESSRSTVQTQRQQKESSGSDEATEQVCVGTKSCLRR